MTIINAKSKNIELLLGNSMYDYDIAISFAGEDRPIAQKISDALVLKGFNIFYDDYEKANMWGKNLYTHLTNVYRNKAKFCLMIISENYARKQWTNLERKAAQSRAFAECTEYILPLKLDDTEVQGMLDTVGHIDYSGIKFDELIHTISVKIHQYNQENNVTYPKTEIRTVLRDAFPDFTTTNATTKCPSCGTRQNLSETPIIMENNDTLYICKNGCQPVVVIGRPGITAWPGRGYRIGKHVIRNPSDLVIKTLGIGCPLVIKASKAALMKAQPI